jgi:DNA polymerase
MKTGSKLTSLVKKVAKTRESCKECPLRGRALVVCQTQYTKPKEDCDILFVGVNPGNEEAKQGIPFCGPSGKLLRDTLEKHPLNKLNIAFTNIILCSTSDERELQSFGSIKDIAKNCKGLTNGIRNRLNPQIIVAVGKSAAAMFEFPGLSIVADAGKSWWYKDKLVCAIMHPSYIIRNGRNEELMTRFSESIRGIRGLLAGSSLNI